ncbi:helix-turn-helix transcriptional regulator [Persicobacter diffluens]|uniref:helix-turn-helix transcriptional regulator n=1 Tax=Persicobacter diffluens TaxID=981 RepID=UPI0030C7095D
MHLKKNSWTKHIGIRIYRPLLLEILGEHHPLFQQFVNKEPFSYSISYSREVGVRLDSLFTVWGTKMAKIEAISKTYDLLATFFSDFNDRNDLIAEAAPCQNVRERYLMEKAENIKTMLEENYQEPPTSTEIARSMGMSESNVRKIFKEYYGTSLYAYVKAHRLEVAKEMLINTDWPVKLIGHRVGYTHMGQFSKLIKQTYGKLPSAIREEQ